MANKTGKWNSFIKVIATIGALIIMLLPGVLFDSVYWGYIKWDFGSKVINCLRFLMNYGVTYSGAFEILNSSIGVLMTMVSLFITLSINMSERAEKKVYGILRKELPEVSNKKRYRYIKNMSYFAPILMIGCLNLSYCVTGYFLYAYCYIFFVLHYRMYAKSYGSKQNQEAVVKKLLCCFSKTEKCTDEDIRQYKMLLEKIEKNLKDEGNWSDVEQLFKSLVKSAQEYPNAVKYSVCYYFVHVIYWTRGRKSEITRIKVLKLLTGIIDCENVNNQSKKNKNFIFLWATFELAVCKSDIKELNEFMHWISNDEKRSIDILKQTGWKLETDILQLQAAMVLVLLEYSLQNRNTYDGVCVRKMKSLWDYAEIVFQRELDETFEAMLYFLDGTSGERAEQKLHQIMRSLRNDYQHRKKTSLIANIIWLEGEKENEE